MREFRTSGSVGGRLVAAWSGEPTLSRSRLRGVDAAREGGARADAAEGELSRTTDPHRYGIHRDVNKSQRKQGALGQGAVRGEHHPSGCPRSAFRNSVLPGSREGFDR